MINVSVFADDAIQGQLVANHIGQYLENTGFSNVEVDRTMAPSVPEPATQSDALEAIRNLNPGLFEEMIQITPEISGGAIGPAYPDEPEA